MPSFSNLKSLQNFLVISVKQSLSNEVKDEVKKVYKENIQNIVYNVYDPKVYKRRNSLLQEENIKSEVSDIPNGIELTIVNEAPYNPDYNGTPVELPELIEYGHGYNSNYYDYYERAVDKTFANPRPFTEKTIEELNTSKQHIRMLQKSLKNKGIDSV